MTTPTSLLTLSPGLELSATSVMEALCLPDRGAGLHPRCRPNGRIWRRRAFTFHHGSACRLFASGSNTSLPPIDEFDRTRKLGPRRTGRALLVVRSSRRRYCFVGCL